MNGKVDLHTHTTHSDGANTPRELIQKVKNAGIDVLSITDHDNINGVKEAVKIGKELGVEIIPGVEISSEIGNREIHILGYFFDTENQELEHYLNFFREERIKRAGRIVNKLRNLGFNIDNYIQEDTNYPYNELEKIFKRLINIRNHKKYILIFKYKNYQDFLNS